MVHSSAQCFYNHDQKTHHLTAQPCTFDLEGPVVRRLDIYDKDACSIYMSPGNTNLVDVSISLPTSQPLVSWTQIIERGLLFEVWESLLSEILIIHSKISMYPTAESLLDIVLVKGLAANDIVFLRPLTFTHNLAHLGKSLIKNFIKMLRLASECGVYSTERINFITPIYSKSKGINQKTCTLEYIMARPPKFIKCCGDRQRCPHKAVMKTVIEAINLKRPIPNHSVCHKVIPDILSESDYEHVCKIFFARDIFAKLGRTTIMHCLFCFPECLITHEWILSLLNMFKEYNSRRGNKSG